MNEQTPLGLPPIDDEYQGPSWWHLSRLADAVHSHGMRRIALIGLLVQIVAIVTAVFNVTLHWNGIPITIGGYDFALTIFPPYLLSVLSALWLGPTWGLVPAYAANLTTALISGISPGLSVLFALAGALEILIFWGSMVTLNISPDLRRRRDFVRFLAVSFIAPVTASVSVLIWNTSLGLTPAEGQQIWRGWIIGDILQAVLLLAPLLHFAGPSARRWLDRQFATPPRYDVTYTRAAIIAAGTFALLALLTFVGIFKLQESLDVDPEAVGRGGELLLPRIQEMQFYLVVLVAALTVTTGVFSTTLARMGERQRRLSRRESLTGCFNRRAFHELFPREVERARRLGQGVSLVFLDIDHFKAINDRYGHETGDRVLQQLAVRVQALVRETDLLFRWGGEEFVILLAHTAAHDAPALAERVRSAVADRPFLEREYARSIAVTVSVGTAGSTSYPVDPDALLARADAACYRAKELGRNRVVAENPLSYEERTGS
jgi:diguanylate cyclase (GGDEF)-like protein